MIFVSLFPKIFSQRKKFDIGKNFRSQEINPRHYSKPTSQKYTEIRYQHTQNTLLIFYMQPSSEKALRAFAGKAEHTPCRRDGLPTVDTLSGQLRLLDCLYSPLVP